MADSDHAHRHHSHLLRRRASLPLARVLLPQSPALVTTGLLAAIVAAVTMDGAQFLTAVLLGAFVGGLAPAVRRSVVADEELGSTEALRDIGAWAAAGCVAGVTVGVLAVTLGPSGWGPVLTVAPAYVMVRAMVRSGSRHGVRAFPATRTGRALAAEAADLRHSSTEEIAAGWVASHSLLRAASSPARRAYVAALRQAYLDELERRDPAGVRRWLASVPDASADPRHYLDEGRDDGGHLRHG